MSVVLDAFLSELVPDGYPIPEVATLHYTLMDGHCAASSLGSLIVYGLVVFLIAVKELLLLAVTDLSLDHRYTPPIQ